MALTKPPQTRESRERISLGLWDSDLFDWTILCQYRFVYSYSFRESKKENKMKWVESSFLLKSEMVLKMFQFQHAPNAMDRFRLYG